MTEVPWGKVTLYWESPSDLGGPPAAGIKHYILTRQGGQIAQVPPDDPATWTDNFPFALNTRYDYGVYAVVFYTNGDFNDGAAQCYQEGSVNGRSATLYTFMDKIPTAATCSVDSRLDHRKNPTVLRNYRFGYSLYKGGMFVGFVDDPSKVARTYLRFSIPTPPYDPTDGLWSAYLRCYHTATHEDSIDYVTDPQNPPSPVMTLGTHFCADTSWLQNGTHWSNAPTFNATPTASVLVPVNPYNGYQWLEWRVTPDVAGRTALTEVLKAVDETQKTWKYFAKKEYSNNNQPFILRATGKNTTPP